MASAGSGDAAAAPGDVPSVPGFTVDSASADPGIREDQVTNAVSFLSHPKVRGSSEAAKRSFLEKKGLTAAEIDEACKRVPPEAPQAAVPSTSSTPSVGANNLVTYTQQPAMGQLTQQHMPPAQALAPAAQPMQMMQPQRPPLHWSQVVLGLGVAAAGVYGLHQLLVPRLTAWSQQLCASRKAEAVAEAERTAALTSALERLSEGQERLQDTLEGLTAAIKQQQQQQRGFAESQADYLACSSPSLGRRPQQQQQQQQYDGGLGSSYYGRDGPQTVDTYGSSSRAAAVRGGSSSWDPYASDASYYRPAAAPDGRPGSAASPSGRTPGATGGGPSGYYGSSATGFEVTPPPGGNFRAPQPPAQYGGGGRSSSAAQQPGAGAGGPSGVDPGYARRAGAARPEEPSAAGSAAARPEEAPRSAAFHEVMAMVQAGITPPNVRTDIDDNPPDPSRPLSAPQMPPRAKPWEGGSMVSSNGYSTPGAAYSSNVVPDGPSGFGVRGYGGAGPVTPTSAPHAGSSSGPPSAAGGVTAAQGGEEAAGTVLAAPKDAVGYDLSQLLGADAARDAPWRPPPPPAATVQRPLSSGSTSNKQQLAGAESAPPAAPAEADVQQPAATLPSAASAPAVSAATAVTQAASDARGGAAEPAAVGVYDGSLEAADGVEQAA